MGYRVSRGSYGKNWFSAFASVLGQAAPIWSWLASSLSLAGATFTRASTAYVADNLGRLWQAAAGWPRFQGARIADPLANGQLVYYSTDAGGAAIDPATISLLMEPAETNLLPQSEAITDIGAGVSLTANTTASIHGGLTADTLTVTGGGYKYARILLNIATGFNTYTSSAWVKYGNWRYISFRPLSAVQSLIIYDFQTNLLTTNPSPQETVLFASATIEGSFIRLDVTIITNSSLNSGLLARYNSVALSDGSTWTENASVPNGSTVIVGPMQSVKSGVRTSYIPTTTAAAVRAVDALSFTGVPSPNETRMVVNGVNVDIDNWSGIYPTPTNPNLVNSIKVYEPGKRP